MFGGVGTTTPACFIAHRSWLLMMEEIKTQERLRQQEMAAAEKTKKGRAEWERSRKEAVAAKEADWAKKKEATKRSAKLFGKYVLMSLLPFFAGVKWGATKSLSIGEHTNLRAIESYPVSAFTLERSISRDASHSFYYSRSGS